MKEKYTQRIIDLLADFDEKGHLVKVANEAGATKRIWDLTISRAGIIGEIKAYKTILEDLG